MKTSAVVLLAAVSFIFGWIVRSMNQNAPCRRDTTPRIVIVRDTVRVTDPTARSVRILRHAEARLPTASCVDSLPDSATVGLDIVQKTYTGENFRAYVSGWQPKLDSLVLTPASTIITMPRTIPAGQQRFSIGIQAGYGMTPRGLQPYIGIGIGIKIF